jgi:iron complex transport system substrate-binding protein
VSLSPSVTEILFALGAGPQVGGLCAPANYPPEAASVPVVATWDAVDVEAIVALKPSACFTVEGMQGPQALASLRRLGVPVVVYPMRSLDDLWACIRSIGERIGRGAQGEALAASLEARVRAAAPPPGSEPQPALVVVGVDPVVAAGPRSFLDGVLRAAGFRNVCPGAGESYPALSLEDAARCAPRWVIFPEGEFSREAAQTLTDDVGRLTGRPVRSLFIPADLLVRPGPRTPEAVERLRAALREGGAP